MVAFNANKNERNLNKNLLNVLPSKKKKTQNNLLLPEEGLPGGLRCLSKRPTWKNYKRTGRQI